MPFPDRLQQLLREIKDNNCLLLVEGKKDRQALQCLGFDNIVTLAKPLYKVVEELETVTSEVAILTDLDGEGRRLYRRLQHECSQRGIKVNNKLRLFLLQETPLAQVEGLPTYLRNLERKNGPSRSFPDSPDFLGSQRFEPAISAV